ncbi:MAG: hypothetical protein GXO36_05680 [Chloroflexi bacterium]|nr:hypothetical protein [Chloroflexota bacterium]
MTQAATKPVFWTPDPKAGYQVQRRPDGGLTVTFWRVDPYTLRHWRRFAQAHELNSDRLNRNLYDLRALDHIPEEAIQYAVEVNSDPAARRVRVAVVVSHPQVREAVERVIALTPGSGAEIRVFTDLDQAEAWLAQPLEEMV